MIGFERHLAEKGASPSTVVSYLTAARQLAARLGGSGWRGLDTTSASGSVALPSSTPPELNDAALLLHKDWLAASYAPKTVNQRIAGINTYLDFAGYDGIRLKGIRIQQKPFLDNVISKADYERLRDGLLVEGDLYWYFVVRFLAGTGARVSEARLLTCESVRAGHLDLVGKGDKLRRVYVPAPLRRDALNWLNAVDRSAGYLFTSAAAGAARGGRGDPDAPMTARGIALGLKRAADRHGVDPDVVYPHSFRHLFAKEFLARNPDLTLLADLMGHDSIETTRIYLRRTAAEQRAAVDAAVDW